MKSARGSGYRGWNGAAVDYWQRELKEQPITPGLTYPMLPTEITHGRQQASHTLFRPVTASPPAASTVFHAKRS